MSGQILTQRPTLNLPEAELLDERLKTMVVEESTDGLYRCELSFENWMPSGTDYLYFDRQVIDFGKPLTITMGAGSSAVPLFSGRIMAIEGRFLENRLPEIALLAEDRLQDLRMTRRTRTFTEVTDAAIFQQIASENGLTASATLTGGPQSVVVQLNQSDLAFLRERARANDAEVWVDGQTIYAAPRSSRGTGQPVTLTYGANLWEFSVLADLAHQRSSMTVTGWDTTAKQAITAVGDSSAISGELSGMTSGASILQSAVGERKDQVVHAMPFATQEAQSIATALYNRSARRFVTGAGIAQGDARIRVGATVQIMQVGTLFSGTYYVTETRHLFDNTQGYRTQFRVERPGIGG